MELLHQKGQAKVIAHVIDAGICVRCGACVGICPYFDFFNGKVVVLDRCYAEPSKCAQICPRIAYAPTSPIKKVGNEGEIGETFGLSQRGGPVMSHIRVSKEKKYGPLIPPNRAQFIIGLEPLETLRIIKEFANSG